jgi:molybdopterin-guanine dinucleotide biosynthesis protein A
VHDALVLAGGGARRMGGADKPALLVGGLTLLDRVLLATEAARGTVVVGPERPTARPVRWTREEPPGGGPVAGLAAGLALVEADLVVLLAADLPFLTAAAVEVLLSAVGSGDGALMTDGTHPQWLCGAWRTAALRDGLQGLEPAGARLRAVLGGLDTRLVPWTGTPAPWEDCDTQDDLERARELAT